MNRRISYLCVLLFLFSVTLFAEQPSGTGKNSEIQKIRNWKIQISQIQKELNTFVRRADRDQLPIKFNAGLQKHRLLVQLRRIEKEIRKVNSIPALKVIKEVSNARQKVRGMDQMLQTKLSRKELIEEQKRQHKENRRVKSKVLSGSNFISGTIVSASNSDPISNVEVEIYDSNGDFANYGYTDTSGNYSISVEEGTYFARTYSYDNYVDELYDNFSCESNCNVLDGTPIIAVGSVAGINFELSTSGLITGTVTDSVTNEPLASVEIDIYDSTGNHRAYAYTDTAGNYTTTGTLSTGNYYASAAHYGSGYLRELYNNLPCANGCDVLTGTPIQVVSGATTPDINFTLDPGGSISGSVLTSSNLSPVSGYVSIYDSNGNYASEGPIDSDGSYTARGLLTGTYYAVTQSYDGFIDELYNGISCYWQYCEPRAGTPISVTFNQTTNGIDFQLQRGAIIRGHVRDELTEEPIEYSGITIYDSSGNYAGYGYTEENGSYAVKGLAEGTYFAATCNYDGYRDELYDNIPCPSGYCDPLDGTPISAQYEQPSQANFKLLPGGKIAGKVKDSSNGEPIEYAEIAIYDSKLEYVAYGYTDETGKYVTSGIPTGDYFAVTSSYGNWIDEVYNDHPCPRGNCTISDGDLIAVSAGNTTPGINFYLEPGGTISGNLTSSSTSNPIFNFFTFIFDSQGNNVSEGYSNGDGSYSAYGLATGNYYVVTANFENYIDELYNNIPCSGGVCNPLLGTPVFVITSEDTGGINFALNDGGSISGTITDFQTSDPLEYVDVNIFDSAGNFVAYGYTDETGNYQTTSSGLDSGNYFAVASVDENYLDEIYNNILCSSCDPLSGTPIGVTAGSNTGAINFELDRGGSISGVIVDAETTVAVSSNVEVYDSSGNYVSYGYPDSTGNYTIENLPPGNYFVVAYSNNDYIGEVFDNIECPLGSCNPLSGTPVPVSINTETSGINFSLDTCDQIDIGPPLLPSGIIGELYDQTIFISGGSAPYRVSIEYGYLPNGLSLDSETGIISGIPTASGISGFRILVEDVNGCRSYWTYSITITSGESQYSDDFEDGVLSNDWSYKGQWNESNGTLNSTANSKTRAIAERAFEGKLNCTLQTKIRITENGGGHISVLGWYQNSKDYVELMLKEQENRWILKQRSDGKVVSKAKATSDIQQDVAYNVSITFDGTRFVVTVDNQTIITMPAGSAPHPGSVGYEVKSATGSFDFMTVM